MRQDWRGHRKLLSIFGCAIGMALAFVGGYLIADLQRQMATDGDKSDRDTRTRHRKLFCSRKT